MISNNMTVEIKAEAEDRPIALFVQVASQYESSVYVELENKRVNAKSIMGMMALGLRPGERIKVTADGVDENKAIEGIRKYLKCEN